MSDNIPHELIAAEILTKLPSKSLIKFRCVCKLWRNLITDPTFIQNHLNQSIQNNSLDFIASKIEIEEHMFQFHQLHMYRIQEENSLDKITYFRNPFESPSRNESILVGSCNGIVCLANCQVICFINPTTKEYKSVRIGKKLYASQKNDYFAPEVNAYGFGYDPLGDDYKCVQIRTCSGGMRDFNECNVFSMRNDGSCKTISNVPYDVAYAKESGVSVSGDLHWIFWVKGELKKVIVAFDMGKNVFREVPRPDAVDRRSELNLGSLRGQLCVLRKDVRGSDIDIWVMKSYGLPESWTKVISMNPIYSGDVQHRLTPLGFGKNGEIVLKCEESLDLYNPKNKTVEHLGTRGDLDRLGTQGIFDWSKVSGVVPHVDSLVSLKSYTSRA